MDQTAFNTIKIEYQKFAEKYPSFKKSSPSETHISDVCELIPATPIVR